MPDQNIHQQAEERREGKTFAKVWLGTAITAIAAVIVVFFLWLFGGR